MGKWIVAVVLAAALLVSGCDAADPGPDEASASKAEAARQHQAAKAKRQAKQRAARLKAARAERRRRAAHRRAVQRRRAIERRRRAARKAAEAKARQRAAEKAAQEEAERRAREEAEPAPPESNCHPSYEGACLDPSMSDYDCAGGSGDGPAYTGPVRVVGPDEYGLDRDGDGYACE